MKAYLWTTGIVFGLITAAHLWRLVLEGTRRVTEPFFVLLTLLSLGLCLWSAWLLRTASRRQRP